MLDRDRILRAVRRFHLCVGVCCAAYFLFLGVLMAAKDHRHSLGLDAHHVSRTWLPAHYRAAEPQVRADVVLADLHAGIMGPEASAVMEGVAALAFVLLLSGAVLYRVGRALPQALPVEVAGAGNYPFPVIAGGKPREPKVLTFRRDR